MLSVLLVDDEDALLNLTKIFLEKGKDINVTTTLSAFDALTLMESNSFHAVVSDYEMPLMNGIDFLKSVKSRGDDTPFIIFTGRGREYVAIDALNCGASFYLQKGGDVPAQYAELRNMIHQAAQRKQSEQALLNSEERYRAVVESQMELICRFQPDGTFLFVNGAFCRYYGRTMDELVGHQYRAKLFPEDRLLISSHFSSLTPEKPTGTMEHRIICPQIGTRWQQWSDTAIFGERGEVIEYQSVGRDITDRKTIEDELQLLKVSVDRAADEVFWLDFEGNILYVNDAACRITGYSREEFLTMKIFKLDPDFTRGIWDKTVADLRERKTQIFTTRHRRKDGVIIDVEINTTYVNKDKHEYSFAFARDISERKRAEASLQQANRKLHLLSGITRHDINNQLTVLAGYIELLKNKYSNPSVNEYFMNITNAAERISAMIQFAKEYENIGVATPAWQDIRAIVNTAAMETLHGQVVVKNDIPAGTEVFADTLVVKVFYNLMDNAIRHGGGISSIKFSTRKLNDELLIFCEDDGTGISADEKERIFALGYGKHTGFGLYLAREILSITGITLDEIGEPGKGARFRLQVPMKGFRTILEQRI
jgi:PAS domain S-box-containing protein